MQQSGWDNTRAEEIRWPWMSVYCKHGRLSIRVCVCVCESLSHVRLFATPWTIAHRASLSIGFSRQEYWSGLPFPAPGDLPNPGIKPGSPALQADSLPAEPPGKIISVCVCVCVCVCVSCSVVSDSV